MDAPCVQEKRRKKLKRGNKGKKILTIRPYQGRSPLLIFFFVLSCFSLPSCFLLPSSTPSFFSLFSLLPPFLFLSLCLLFVVIIFLFFFRRYSVLSISFVFVPFYSFPVSSLLLSPQLSFFLLAFPFCFPFLTLPFPGSLPFFIHLSLFSRFITFYSSITELTPFLSRHFSFCILFYSSNINFPAIFISFCYISSPSLSCLSPSHLTFPFSCPNFPPVSLFPALSLPLSSSTCFHLHSSSSLHHLPFACP